MKDTILLPRKAPIGSSSRSSTDLTYLHHEMEQRADPPARREWFSAARPRTEFRCRCSCTTRSRQASGSATSTGDVLARLVDERAAGDARGAGALLTDIAEHSFSEACEG